MRFPTPVSFALGAAAAVALLAGCSSSSVPSTVANAPGGVGTTQQSRVRHFTVVSAIPKGFVGVRHGTLRFYAGKDTFIKGGVYAGQFASAAINEYGLPNKHNKAPRCTDGPASAVNGLGFDSATRTMWDPDGGSRSLIPFAANCGGAGTAIAENNGQPSDIAVDGNTIYVADNSLNTIDVYTGGSYTGALSNSACGGGGFGDAVDQHNVFQACTTGQIIEYTGGTGSGTQLSLTGLGAPIGMTFDRHHNLIVVDLATGILVYKPPYSGSPSSTGSVVGSSTYTQINAANTDLYVGDYVNGTVDVYSYPSLAYEYSISNGLSASGTVEGIAVDSQGHQLTP
jgi:hypothetical protein